MCYWLLDRSQMSKHQLTANQPVCAATEKMLSLMESAGTRREQLGLMQKDGENKCSQQHPTRPSFPILLLVGTGGVI